MRWLKTALAEIYGLFVEDGRYAITIVVWLALAWLVLPALALGDPWNAAILFAGLLVILLGSVLRDAQWRYAGCAGDHPCTGS